MKRFVQLMNVNQQDRETKSINSSEKKKKSPIILKDPLTECPMNDKDTANCINNFFASPTKDYPEVKNKWSECGELDILYLQLRRKVLKGS